MNAHLDKSSSMLDESQLSLLIQAPKSQADIRNEELMKQVSSARSTIRQLRQDNQWLATAKEGLQNECSALRELLLQKKQMLIELNSEMKMVNQELNRLQDELREKDKIIMEKQQQLCRERQNQTKIREEREQAELELKKKDDELVQLNKMIDKMREEKIQQKETFFREVNHKLTRIIEKEISKQADVNNQMILIEKIETILEEKNVQTQQLQQKISQLNQELIRTSQDLGVVREQLQEATELLEEAKQSEETTISSARALEKKIQTNSQSAAQSYRELSRHHNQTIDQLISVFSPLVKGEEELVSSLGQLMKISKPHRQIPILLDQLKGVIVQRNLRAYRGSQTMRQLNEQKSKHKALQEEIQILKLKHLTLQRQYEAVLDDNRRVIKFHNLSRYRLDRNLKPNKENLMMTANSSQ